MKHRIARHATDPFPHLGQNIIGLSSNQIEASRVPFHSIYLKSHLGDFQSMEYLFQLYQSEHFSSEHLFIEQIFYASFNINHI